MMPGMGSGRRRYHGPFVQLQANTYLDDAIRRVGPWGELLFVRSLQLAKIVNRDGFVSWAQLGDISRGIYAFSRICDRLVEEKLWVSPPHVDGIYIRQWSKYNDTTATEEAKKDQDAARKREARARVNQEKDVDVSDRTVQTHIREEKKREESVRSPSGSDRTDSAPAAPRGTGGAAQPAGRGVVPSGLSETAKAAAAAARASVAEAQARVHPKLNRPPVVNGKEPESIYSRVNALMDEEIAEQQKGDAE